jgi:hypothetical protein
MIDPDNVHFDEMLDVAEVQEVITGRKGKKLRRYTKEEKNKAKILHGQGLNIAEISKELGIPRTNISAWIKDHAMTDHGGQNQLLTAVEEKIVVDFIVLLSRLGTPLVLGQIGDAVGDLLKNDPRYNTLKNGKPSKFKIFLHFLTFFL